VSLALRRLLAALGGAFGVLPLLPIARGRAQILGGPPLLPGAELMAGDIKAGTYAELAVLLLAVPAAAFFFGRLLPDFVHSRGGFAIALPGVFMTAGFVMWRLGMRPVVSLTCGLAASLLAAAVSIAAPFLLGRRAVVVRQVEEPIPFPDQEPYALPRWALALVAVAMFAVACRLWPPQRGPLDLFEEGQILSAVSVYLAGGIPYRDTYPVHGWGTDGGVDAAAARLFGDTVEVMRTRRAVWGALGVSALALGSWALFRRPLWSLTAFVLALCLCPFPSERQAPAFAGLAALIAAAQSGRRRAWLGAGALGAAVLFYALEYGGFLLAAGALTIGTAAILERRYREGQTAGLAFLGGAILGSAPFLAMLAWHGAFIEFLRTSFVQVPATIEDVWGLPAPSAIPLLRHGNASALAEALLRAAHVPWLFHATILASAAALLLLRSRHPGWSRTDRAALAATWFSVIAMRGALGRADFGHLVMHGVFAALPASWLLFRAAHARHARWLLAPALAAGLVVAVRPLWLGGVVLSSLRGQGRVCERPLGDRGRLPCAQADDLSSLRAWIDREIQPDETFFDFGNEPALYYLLERRPPIRFPCVPCYESEAAQREVIAAIEREKLPLAILASGSWYDNFDGVQTRVRAPLVAEYLDLNYEPIARIGPRTIGRRLP